MTGMGDTMASSSFTIINAAAVLPDGILEDCLVRCADGRIAEIKAGAPSAMADGCIVDGHGGLLVPGFIDLHTHGARGHLASDSREELEAMSAALARYGVTGFLPSVCTLGDPGEDLLRMRELSRAKSPGAAILGFLLEGHFLALTGAIPSLPGGQSLAQVRALIEACSPYKAVFAISPEVPGICNLIPAMAAPGVPVFLTHTAATWRQTEEAIAAGARHATHFYDVFPYPGDRETGVRGCGAVEAVMADRSVTVDFILDGEHVEPIAVKMALQCKGPDKVCLITDANVNAGMPPGRYPSLGGYHVDVLHDGGPARIAEDGPIPGALSGSGLTMDRAVRNAMRLLGLDLAQAVRMASANPAAVLGLSKSKGSILEGYDADLVMLDRELNVELCWTGGVCRYDGRVARG